MVKRLRIQEVYRIGPKRIAKLSRDYAGIYLPKDLGFLKGRLVQITIEVLKEVDT
ncbi:MAG: hypothetical protein J7K21_02245 [Desulfurococcales archaeon]|nr:hypothetical protein [Desulfurococcales archaeon]